MCISPPGYMVLSFFQMKIWAMAESPSTIRGKGSAKKGKGPPKAKGSPKGSPKASPKGSPRASPKGSPRVSPKGSAKGKKKPKTPGKCSAGELKQVTLLNSAAHQEWSTVMFSSSQLQVFSNCLKAWKQQQLKTDHWNSKPTHVGGNCEKGKLVLGIIAKVIENSQPIKCPYRHLWLGNFWNTTSRSHISTWGQTKAL